MKTEVTLDLEDFMFQSRNRDAFHFRGSCGALIVNEIKSFNLAIEMLFISGWCLPGIPLNGKRFNLAIEMLFISGPSAIACTRESV